MASLSNTTKDHEQIRSWAEARDAKPSHVKSTESKEDIGILRLDFPGFSGADSLEEISWDAWFEKFDERDLALVYQEETADGERSNFNKIISGETVEETSSSGKKASAQKKSAVKKTATKKAVAKKSAPAKKSIPAKKSLPAKKSVPTKKSAPAKKAAPKKAALKKAVPKKAAPKKAVKQAPLSKKTTAKKATKKTASSKRR